MGSRTNLIDYIFQHTIVKPLGSIESGASISVRGKPSADAFYKLTQAFPSPAFSLDPFNGEPHSLGKIETWLGTQDRDIALGYMVLAEHLKFGKIEGRENVAFVSAAPLAAATLPNKPGYMAYADYP